MSTKYGITDGVGFLLFIVCALLIPFIGNAQTSISTNKNICVLVYELPSSTIAKGVHLVFGHDPSVLSKYNAKPKDLIDCIEKDYSEIIIVAHALEIKNDSPLRLGYFISNPKQANQYRMGIFLDHVFKKAIVAAKSKKIKIRWMSCAAKEVLQNYPSLQNFLSIPEVSVDFAPTSFTAGLFEKHKVVAFNSRTMSWLAQSLPANTDCHTLLVWKTQGNMYCEKDWWPSCDRKTARRCSKL
ncbi:MAG: hypothetical protein ACOYOK_05250 [Pseudobdellovibrionaceae bacterium]